MKYIMGFMLLVYGVSGLALELNDSVDVSRCFEKTCSAAWVQKGTMDDGTRYIAYFDIVDIDGDGVPTFMPLFNIYNQSSEVVRFSLSMELLDDDMNPLVKVSESATFKPLQVSGSQQSFRSLNGADLDPAMKDRIKRIRVKVEQILHP